MTANISINRILIVLLALALATTTVMASRPPRAKRTVRIVLDQSELKLGPNQTVTAKAMAIDAQGEPIPNARITWTVIKGSKESVQLQPLNQTGHIALSTQEFPTAALVIVRATAGRASADLAVQLQNPEPAEIIFPDGNKVELPVQSHKTIKAYVLSTAGNRLQDAEIIWSLADPEHEPFVLVGKNVNKGGVNSVEITWLGGKADIKTPSELKLVARSGNARGVVKIDYKIPKLEATKLTTDPKKVEVRPGETVNVQLTVRGEDERVLKVDPGDIKAEIADESARAFIKAVVPDGKTISLLGSYGDPKTPPPDFLQTALVIRVGSGVTTIPLTYVRNAAVVDWDILPPNIVADNYGRTIKNDYYCIEVTIQNNSGSDLALAGLRFDSNGIRRPNTSYSTVHGSMARRKIMHPRTMTLAIVDGLGSLLTGFNPFFHNVSHAKNYSQFIDILSNPLAKGLERAWPDSFPGEMSRFEQDVLRDDKIIPNAGIFKTKIFVPKRGLFENGDKKRDDLNEVRKALGTLWVLGYKFQKGPVQSIATAP